MLLIRRGRVPDLERPQLKVSISMRSTNIVNRFITTTLVFIKTKNSDSACAIARVNSNVVQRLGGRIIPLHYRYVELMEVMLDVEYSLGETKWHPYSMVQDEDPHAVAERVLDTGPILVLSSMGVIAARYVNFYSL